jgi:histone H3/H4
MKELARRIQSEGAKRAQTAAVRADQDHRKTLMAADFGGTDPPDKDAVALPIAPVDRIARLNIDDRYRVSMDARIVLAAQLEAFANQIAAAAALLARHAQRRTITADDIGQYFQLEHYFE